MDERTEITGAQVRMARAFLRWSVADLARRAKVGISSVQRIEATDGSLALADDLEWRVEARNRVLAAVRDTVWNADAAEAAAGDEQTRMAGEGAVDRRHAFDVPDLVLRVGALPAIDARQQRRATDAEQRRQRGQRGL